MKVTILFDDGDEYVQTEEDIRELAGLYDDCQWMIDNFMERCVTITQDERIEYERLYNVMVEARGAYSKYIRSMGTRYS